MHKRLKAFERMAIDGRQTRINATVIVAAAAVVTSTWVWGDRLLQLLHRRRRASSRELQPSRTRRHY